MAFNPVTFNEGAPLDPKALNDLQTNATIAYTQSNNLVNSSNGSQYTTIMDCGIVQIKTTTPGVAVSADVDMSAFSDPSLVRITANVASGFAPAKNETVSIMIQKDSKPKIWLTSTVNHTYTVNWIAVQKKSA